MLIYSRNKYHKLYDKNISGLLTEMKEYTTKKNNIDDENKSHRILATD